MFTPERKSEKIVVWRTNVREQEPRHTLHISDVHFDSAKCNREMLRRHLEEIKACEGQAFIYGDWFDVMGCFQDPRTKAADIRPEYYVKGREYLNAVIEDSVEFLRPYAKNIAFIGEGNHESEIRRRRDVDILAWMVRLLHEMGSSVVRGAYTGWNEFVMQYKPESSRNLLTHYHHGYGGGAKRSKGMLDSQIATFQYPDADIIFRGHDHQKFHDPSNVKYRYNDKFKIESMDTTHYIKTGSYKESATGTGGWEVQKGFMPSRLGGWFIDMQVTRLFKAEDPSRPRVIDLTIREAV
jgi:hypothetical protein